MNLEKNILRSQALLKSIAEHLCCTSNTLASLSKYTYLHGIFTEPDIDTMGELIITASSAGIYTSLITDGNSGTFTFDLNSTGDLPFSSPLTLIVGDTLTVKRTSTGSTGWFELSGIYA